MKPASGGGSRFANGDTLFARITPCTENGKTALVRGLAEREVATGSTEFIVLRPRPNVTLPKFAYYLAKNPVFRSFAVSRMIGTSGRQRVPLDVFDEFRVGVPHLSEQHKIVAILSSVDDAIEKAYAVIEQVQVVKRGLVQRLFDPNALATRHGWRTVRLGDVVDQRTEKSRPAPSNKLPYVALEHLAQGRPSILGWFESNKASSAKTFFRAGDVLFGKLRPNLRKAALAPFDGVCSTDIMPLYCGDDVDGRYLVQLTHWHPLQRYAMATASGTKMPRTSWKQLRTFTFQLPPLHAQRRVIATLCAVDEVIERHEAAVRRLMAVKRSLLPVLLGGTQRVMEEQGVV